MHTPYAHASYPHLEADALCYLSSPVCLLLQLLLQQSLVLSLSGVRRKWGEEGKRWCEEQAYCLHTPYFLLGLCWLSTHYLLTYLLA